MRIEKKIEEEIARRKGMTVKTIIQIVWLGISGVISYFLVNYMLTSEEINFSYRLIYNTLRIPQSVPEIVVLGLLIFIGVFVFQIFLWLGFAFASPEGRRKTGDPSLYSRNKDPLDREKF